MTEDERRKFESWDSPEKRRERMRMVDEQIVQRGVRDPGVLEALRSVPRHLFVPEKEWGFAYEDSPLGLGFGQTISQPYIVAFMTEALQLSDTDKVLEVGTGSGFQAAILALLAGHVFTIERISELASTAAHRLSQLGLNNVTVLCRDGSVGLRDQAPFDAIIVTAATPRAPQELLDQLADGGRLVLPVGDREDQVLLKFTREGDAVTHENLGACAFVPLIGQAGWPVAESNQD